MNYLNSYLRSKLDLSNIGFQRGRKEPESQCHTANSSLHFKPAEKIEWRIVFQEKPNEDLTVSLI